MVEYVCDCDCDFCQSGPCYCTLHEADADCEFADPFGERQYTYEDEDGGIHYE